VLDITDITLLQESWLKATKVLTCILEMPSSKQGYDTDNPAGHFLSFAHFVQ